MFESVQDIQSVQLTEHGGWTVNGNTSVPNAPGNRHYAMIQEWIALGNTPEPIPQPTVEEMAAKLIGDLYKNVKRFIEFLPNGFIRYDADLKMNIMAAMILAQGAGEPVPAVCAQFHGWVNAVQNEFLTLMTQIKSGNLEVDVSVEMFEVKYGPEGMTLADPQISTSILMSLGLI